MCLIALAFRHHPHWPLAVVANRDEFHDRPAAPAGPDPDAPGVHGGRDLVQGGGWLQVSDRGRLAAVTNVRTGLGSRDAAPAPKSRGWLVRDFVRGAQDAPTAAAGVGADAGSYGPFNLLLWDGDALAFAGNHPRGTHARVDAGMHAMSNGAFDARWPKTVLAGHALEAWLATRPRGGGAHGGDAARAIDAAAIAPLFDALSDTRVAPDDALPDTGVGLALERALSPPFVRDARYGTRCSSVVLCHADGGIVFAERRFGPDGVVAGESLAHIAPLR